MSNGDRKNGVPTTVTSIPLVDPNAMPANPSIGDLVKDATTQVSTLVRAEVELAKAEITRDVKKGLTGSVFFILALVVLFYSTFFLFFFVAELLDTWLWRWVAFLIVFALMVVTTAVFALLGYLKVRRIRGPQQTIESVKETTAALTPSLAKFAGTPAKAAATTSAPSRPAVRATTVTTPRPATTAAAVTAEPAKSAEYVEQPEYVEFVEPTEQIQYPGRTGSDCGGVRRYRPTGHLRRRPAARRPVGLVMAQPDPSVTRIAGPWRHLDVHANGIRFHCVEALPEAGDDTPPTTRPLVILLHGFGSFWWSWRHQLRGLSGARVVAVDLRGYGGSDKPPRGYDGWTLAGDTAGLIRALGHTSATLVGHADGGLVCWATSVLHSRMVRGHRTGQFTAPGRVERIGAHLPRSGPRAAAHPAGLPAAGVARARADPTRRRSSSRHWSAAQPPANGLPPKTSPRPSRICARRSRSLRQRTARWSTSAGRSAASFAAKAGGS